MWRAWTATLVFFSLFAVGVALVLKPGELDNLTAGALGDLLSGLFAPLALIWFIVATDMQRRELELQRLESKRQNDLYTEDQEFRLKGEFMDRLNVELSEIFHGAVKRRKDSETAQEWTRNNWVQYGNGDKSVFVRQVSLHLRNNSKLEGNEAQQAKNFIAIHDALLKKCAEKRFDIEEGFLKDIATVRRMLEKALETAG